MNRTVNAPQAQRRQSEHGRSAVAESPDDHGALDIETARDPKFMLAYERSRPHDIEPHASTALEGATRKLSVRAENVLKELAVRLIGETPKQGGWTPPDLLVQKLTYKDLVVARNCGPQTATEIIEWAEKLGKTIPRGSATGKSLPAMWQHLAAKCAEGKLSKADLADALGRSIRRGNNRVPLTFQKIILDFLNTEKEDKLPAGCQATPTT